MLLPSTLGEALPDISEALLGTAAERITKAYSDHSERAGPVIGDSWRGLVPNPRLASWSTRLRQAKLRSEKK